jgi:hypothetical protein
MMLEHVIAHNRRPKKALELSTEELMAEVSPAPIDLWNFGIPTRSGALSRYRELDVQYELLPTGTAVVTEKGILFRHCYYLCSEALERGWFVQARKRRFDVEVSYDPRLVDAIYIRDSADRKYFRADLTEVSRRIYGGLSFDEVKFYKHLEKATLFEAEQVRQQVDLEFAQKIAPTIENAKASLKRLPKKSRSAKKADIKEDRLLALQQERQTTAKLLPYSRDAHSPATGSQQPGPREPRLHEVGKAPSPAKSSLAAQVAEQRRKIQEG